MRVWKDKEKKFKQLINILRDNLDKPTEMHTHEFVEIEYVLSGSGVQLINGVEYPVHRGDLIYLKKGDYHTYFSTNQLRILNLFNHRNINDLVPEIIYYYLFQGLSLTAIEVKLFRTEDYHGWLSKTFLNYYGIDTEKENKGIYANKTVPEVVNELYKSSEIAHIRVAKLLKEKYL